MTLTIISSTQKLYKFITKLKATLKMTASN